MTHDVKREPGDVTPGMEVTRRQRSQEIMEERAQRALDPVPQAEFDRQLDAALTTQKRIEKTIREVLRQGVHFGNPNRAFPRDILMQAGAEELRRVWGGLRIVETRPADVIADDEWVCVTVHAGIMDRFGNMLAQCMSSCNTKEGRFYKRSGKPVWDRDPREKHHDCLMMAQKRAAVRLTLDACAATGYFANDEAMAAALDGGDDAEVWTDEQRADVMQLAARAGMKRTDFERFMRETCDGHLVATKDQVEMLKVALVQWQAPVGVPTEVVAVDATVEVPQEYQGPEEQETEPMEPAPNCPKCGGEMWDNRGRKKTPTGPDFTCKDKEGCTNSKGFATSVWLEAPDAKVKAPAQAETKWPNPFGGEEDDDLPF